MGGLEKTAVDEDDKVSTTGSCLVLVLALEVVEEDAVSRCFDSSSCTESELVVTDRVAVARESVGTGELATGVVDVTVAAASSPDDAEREMPLARRSMLVVTGALVADAPEGEA